MKKRKFLFCISLITLITILLTNILSKESYAKGSSDEHGVYFTFRGITYQVFCIKEMEKDWKPSDLAICIPDDYDFDIREDKEFCERYDLYNGYCDCYVEIEDIRELVTVTMNVNGEPEQYTLKLNKYEKRDIDEVLCILGEGVRGYAFAINKR